MAEPTAAVVLVVDDEPLMRSSLRRLLKREGFAVELAEDGAQALELARRSPPALILLDMRMPRLDGAQFLAAQRADPAIAGVPVVAISANPQQLPEGVAAVFAKPFEPPELIAAIRAHARP